MSTVNIINTFVNKNQNKKTMGQATLREDGQGWESKIHSIWLLRGKCIHFLQFQLNLRQVIFLDQAGGHRPQWLPCRIWISLAYWTKCYSADCYSESKLAGEHTQQSPTRHSKKGSNKVHIYIQCNYILWMYIRMPTKTNGWMDGHPLLLLHIILQSFCRREQ